MVPGNSSLKSRTVRVLRGGRIVVALLALLAAACGTSYLLDCSQLRNKSVELTCSRGSSTERAEILLRWVHDLRGTRENRHYFVLPALRATPLQVLAAGGDCADKSRLLSAMLREIGIPATMVVCYHRETRVPTHTVVEARLGPATYMVMDPAYGLNFPKTKDGFFGLMDLRTDPQIVDRHVRGLVARAAKSDPILSYNPISAAYDHATSINWDKNIATRSARFLFSLWMGDEVYRFSRPLILEEPKLFIAAFLTVVAGIVEASAQLASRRNRLSAASAVFSGAQACGR